MVFDTTHDTNSLGLYLAIFVVQNEFGFTETVGKAFISHQDASTFSRLFIEWKLMMGVDDPALIITDGDAAIASAIKDVFENSKHILCTWHIICKNAVYHLQKLLSKVEMDFVTKLLWDISLKEDSLCESILAIQWNELVRYINEHVDRSKLLLLQTKPTRKKKFQRNVDCIEVIKIIRGI